VPLHLEVITPEGKAYEDDVDMVVAPATDGYVGILPNHVPLFTTLGPGVFKVKRGGVEEILAVFGGFMDVRPDRVIVLTDAAEHPEDIDANRAQEARERAQQILAAGTASAADEQRARAELQRSLVRLRVSEGRRRRR
jgi:F-type H+-transporting ATPase subunit epsilon